MVMTLVYDGCVRFVSFQEKGGKCVGEVTQLLKKRKESRLLGTVSHALV